MAGRFQIRSIRAADMSLFRAAEQTADFMAAGKQSRRGQRLDTVIIVTCP